MNHTYTEAGTLEEFIAIVSRNVAQRVVAYYKEHDTPIRFAHVSRSWVKAVKNRLGISMTEFINYHVSDRVVLFETTESISFLIPIEVYNLIPEDEIQLYKTALCHQARIQKGRAVLEKTLVEYIPGIGLIKAKNQRKKGLKTLDGATYDKIVSIFSKKQS